MKAATVRRGIVSWMEGWQQLLAAVGAYCEQPSDCRCLLMEAVPGNGSEIHDNGPSSFRDRLSWTESS